MAATGGHDTATAARVVDARIVYWGIAGAGKSTNLRAIHMRLREDHRGALRRVPTPLDPSVTYAILPIELGEVSGVRTRLEIVAVPGGADDAATRKQLLDRADGVVFVVDSRRDRLDANVASFEELRRTLAAYGRALEDVPLVIQYNQRDLADPYALEELHRKLEVPGATAFEAIATTGTGVLQTLTTISKRVVRARREETALLAGGPAVRPVSQAPARPTAASAPAPSSRPAPPPAAPAPLSAPLQQRHADLQGERSRASDGIAPPPGRDSSAPSRITSSESHVADNESASDIAGRARSLFGASFHELAAGLGNEPSGAPFEGELAIASVGNARVCSPRTLELPLVLHGSDGREYRTLLTLTLDPLVGDGTPGGRAP